jgi:hypothetical protein
MPTIPVGYKQAAIVNGALSRLRGRFGRNRGALPSSGLGARREAPGKAKISARPDRSQRERLSRAGFEPCVRVPFTNFEARFQALQTKGVARPRRGSNPAR